MPVSKVTTLGPRLDHFSVSKEDAARQAIAALRGYAYQLHQSAAAWIKLSANDQLYLEVAEDFAEVARSADQLGAILTATQVKDTRDSGSVTLNSADVRLAVQHLFALQETNPGRQVRLTFLTTSPVGVERKDPLTDGIPGITAWQLAAAGGNVAKLRSALCGRFNEGPLGKFIRTASDNEFRSRLLESLIFVCDSADWQHVEASNRAALVAMRNEVQATRDTAERAYDALLSYIERLTARHGLLDAVRSLSFSLEKGETVALVGANGAGKTTLMRSLAGAHRIAEGRVEFAGADVTSLAAYERAAAGIALAPEGRRLFAHMSVEENLLLARAAGRTGSWNIDTVLQAFPNLLSLRRSRAGNLSGGEQQATAIGRALMTNPQLLLLDEVSLGLSPLVVDRLYEQIGKLMAQGTTIVLVEQDLKRALRVADRVICMLEGRIVLQGKAADLTREQVTEAYFGLGRALTAQ
jgi:branched-chain amino acid transport system ATP-binding protein